MSKNYDGWKLRRYWITRPLFHPWLLRSMERALRLDDQDRYQ